MIFEFQNVQCLLDLVITESTADFNFLAPPPSSPPPDRLYSKKKS